SDAPGLFDRVGNRLELVDATLAQVRHEARKVHESVRGSFTRRLERPRKRREVGRVGTVLVTETKLLPLTPHSAPLPRQPHIARGGAGSEDAIPADASPQLQSRAFVRQLKSAASGADLHDPRIAQRDARRNAAQQSAEIPQLAAERRLSTRRRTADARQT